MEVAPVHIQERETVYRGGVIIADRRKVDGEWVEATPEELAAMNIKRQGILLSAQLTDTFYSVPLTPDQKAAAAALCWLCSGTHTTQDCPRYDTARRSGNFPAHLARRGAVVRLDEATDVVAKLAQLDPTDGYTYDSCYFCKEPMVSGGTVTEQSPHADDCLWLRARRMTGRMKEQA